MGSIARVKTISPEEATGELKEIYDGIQQAMGLVPNIFQAISLRPPVLGATVNLVGALMLSEGALARELKEMLAVVVSAVNHCKY